MLHASVLQDLRYGARALLRSPGFSAVAVLVLALGVGVNTAVFSLANALFLRPLPVHDPDAVVRVCSGRFSMTRYPILEQLQKRNSTLSGLAGFQLQSFGMRAGGEAEHVFGEIVTGEYFTVLGVQPALGRLLASPDDTLGAPPTVVLSHAFWTRRFAATPDVVGKTLTLNDQPFTIVGVAPRQFTGLMAPLVGAFWVPLATDPVLRPGVDPTTRLAGLSLHLAGRLKPGVDLAQGQADLDTIGRQLRQSRGGAAADDRAAVSVYAATTLHPEIAQPMGVFIGILMALVVVVLLIVCVNLANLTLARAAGRDVEIAVRQSLGAGRGRVVRQLLTESLLLSAAGAAVGFMLAFWATRALVAVQLPIPFPITLDLAPDVRVTAFTALVACIATMAFGTLPALGASRVDLVSSLKGTAGSGARHGRLRATFLIAQVAMSVLLLVVAGLFVRSARNAGSMATGFDASNVMTASVDLETRGYSEARGRDFVRSLSERLAAAPGIASANVVEIIPLSMANNVTYLLREQDAPPARGEAPVTPPVHLNGVGRGHFDTLRIPLRAGRDFSTVDTDGSPAVAIINETMAKRFWPGHSALGQRLRSLDAGAPLITVVGVVADSKYVSLGEEPTPFLYRPLAQAYTPKISVLVRFTGDAAAAVATLRREIQAADAGLPIFSVMSMVDATSVSQLPVQVAGTLLAALGGFALVLAALGIYGVLSYIVRSRTREIGVRVAIGASPRSVAGMVVKQAMTWTVVGAAIGLALALATTRFLVSLLYGVAPTDPWTFTGVTLVLGAVACVAAVVPAVRASRLDPLVALRNL